MTESSFENLLAPMGLSGVAPSLSAESEFNGWHGIKSRLTEFAQLPSAYHLLKSIYDIKDHQAARSMLEEWRGGVFSHIPEVTVLTDTEMQGSLGGYCSELGTIFLPESITRNDFITGQVLLEEYGHHLDTLFNIGHDTEGDEGELFSAVVLSKELTSDALQRLKSEDDSFQLDLPSGHRYFVEASASSYRVERLNSDGNEGHRHTFKIFRTGNTAFAGQVRFSTSSDSATSDVDFSSYSAVRNFAPGQTEDVVYVDSRTDSINEGTERFNVSISKVNNADAITTASTFGQIFNVDSASSYRVDRLNSDGNEGHRHTFKIFRTGNTAVAGQVRFSTSSDSATSDVDFSSYSAVRNFAPGQTEDVVYVDSRTDTVNEGTERFNVSISKVNNADTITTASTFGQIFNVNPTSGYVGELSSWSDTQWNWAAGDNTRITGSESGYTGRSSIQQVYNELSIRLLGKSFNSSAGYVLDPSYYSDPNAGGRYGWHNGIDIDTPNGTPTKVKALIAGTVVSRTTIGNDPKNIFVTVQGDDGRFYVYGHLSSAVKNSGSRVGTGEILGEVGLSAMSNHLHFQVNSTRYAPSGYNNRNQSHVYGWTQNPLKVFWLLRRENRI